MVATVKVVVARTFAFAGALVIVRTASAVRVRAINFFTISSKWLYYL